MSIGSITGGSNGDILTFKELVGAKRVALAALSPEQSDALSLYSRTVERVAAFLDATGEPLEPSMLDTTAQLRRLAVANGKA